MSANIRVLIANPDERVLTSYREFLWQEGFEVDTVTNAIDCVARLRERVPDVLVLDPDLPWGGGSGVLAVMREWADVPAVPVVIQSVEGMCRDSHDEDFPVVLREPKPLAPQRLARVARRLARRFDHQRATVPLASRDSAWDPCPASASERVES